MSNALIEALQRPTLFDHPVDSFELIETHISWVLLTGAYAYKIKKPVDFGFLNFSSLEARKRFCEAEVSLNKRLAPEIYDCVIPLFGDESTPTLNGPGEPFEYMVRMHQFPRGQLLSELQERKELTIDHIDRLGEILANFHADIEIAAADSDFGTATQVMAPVSQNFEQIRPLLADNTDDLRQLDLLQGWAEDSYQRLTPVIEQRKTAGFTRACHGDVHLGNITLFNEQVVLFDCIEFNEEFRWTDTCADIAFLIMDLEARGEEKLANHCLNRYLEISGDYQSLALLNFYKSYRAMVRAKVSLFMMQGVDDSEKSRLLAEYRKYADLAEHYTSVPFRFASITHGLSGSGKSTTGDKLIDGLRIIRVRSDVERKRLYGLAPEASSESELNANIYTPQANEHTYTRLTELCVEILSYGFSVVVDATYLKQHQRQQIHDAVEELGAPFLILSCEAELENIRQWIKTRAEQGGDPSEANLEVLDQQLKSSEPLTEQELQYRKLVKTDDKDSVDSLVERIQQRFGHP
ncbi:AAA family ATPase [Aestuariirhabdus sp. Z084]|uniref:bifunctional aminoglycoside phosphotransferase/ATP-binding protein n=1 Tax=Aestuariirhabdus haliotis TaxID=2918751 RepID=UPI00201B4526|nr:bifunctional aminoglycoside phosphotransferase/ATP-binding protein [Aestuariirhabdus haliotis]MCL6417334.1 AAA family ATPase [Aestuariirhabdus haliotis]MCL6421279.1 AAA family ATPase [Aestuariirhabdus haliotis]